MRVNVSDTAEDLATDAAAEVMRLVRTARGPGVNVGLAGGSTPRATYERLATESIAWEQVVAWPADERWVPPDDDMSNGGMVSGFLGATQATLLRPLWSKDMSPEESAADFESRVRSSMPKGKPDIVILGIGTDGHTASLFPGTEALAETDRWYVSNWIERLDCWRLTATLRLLSSADHVLFLVSGESKAEVLNGILVQGSNLPAALVSRSARDAVWMLDNGAASQLI